MRRTRGSSPRARGTADTRGEVDVCHRFIPARAGNGGRSDPLSRAATVHPRARGERAAQTRDSQGSCRFIPARAGNGAVQTVCWLYSSVHPRARGERGTIWRSDQNLHGSSPRARGTGMRFDVLGRADRFIPARAGNGARPRDIQPVTTVHPRARGERPLRTKYNQPGFGSSPRARGTAPDHLGWPAQVRFIPARAGNGCPPCRQQKKVAVHPRARGERGCAATEMASCYGSSPRARGTVVLRRDWLRTPRFIPARAGNGGCVPGTRGNATVHPRARGERWATHRTSWYVDGSSPRARGTDASA